MTDDENDVLVLLAGLRAARPTESFDQRVRQRCHGAIARTIRSQSSTGKRFGQRAVDAALLAMVGSYAAIALIQATQVAVRLLALH